MNEEAWTENSTRPGAVTLRGHLLAWRWFFAPLGLIFMGVGFYFEQDWQGARAWARYCAGLAARGESAEFSSFIPPAVGDAENLATTPFLAAIFPDRTGGGQGPRDLERLDRVRGLAVTCGAASALVRSSGPPRTNSWARTPLDLPAWYLAFNEATKSLPSGDGFLLTGFTQQEAASDILTALSETDPVFAELREASQRPFCRFDLDYANPNPSEIRVPHWDVLDCLCQVLRLRASAELALSESQEACEEVKLMLRLTDAHRTEADVYSQLRRFVRLQFAIEPLASGLAAHRWTEAQLKALQEQLQGFNFVSDGRRALQCQRTMIARIADCLQISPAQLGEAGIGPAGVGSMRGTRLMLARLVPDGWYSFEKVEAARLLDENLLPAFDVQRRQISPGVAAHGESNLNAELGGAFSARLVRHRLIAYVTLRQYAGLSFKVAFAQAGADSATVAIALERYRLAHGEFPAELAALVPGFLTRVPTDIINGQPLHYERNADGSFLLYSVGWNAIPEGGLLAVEPQTGVVNARQGDWVWRGP